MFRWLLSIWWWMFGGMSMDDLWIWIILFILPWSELFGLLVKWNSLLLLLGLIFGRRLMCIELLRRLLTHLWRMYWRYVYLWRIYHGWHSSLYWSMSQHILRQWLLLLTLFIWMLLLLIWILYLVWNHFLFDWWWMLNIVPFRLRPDWNRLLSLLISLLYMRWINISM